MNDGLEVQASECRSQLGVRRQAFAALVACTGGRSKRLRVGEAIDFEQVAVARMLGLLQQEFLQPGLLLRRQRGVVALAVSARPGRVGVPNGPRRLSVALQARFRIRLRDANARFAVGLVGEHHFAKLERLAGFVELHRFKRMKSGLGGVAVERDRESRLGVEQDRSRTRETRSVQAAAAEHQHVARTHVRRKVRQQVLDRQRLVIDDQLLEVGKAHRRREGRHGHEQAKQERAGDSRGHPVIRFVPESGHGALTR